MANYRFVGKNYYQPLSFQEMLTPWVMYKDAYEKAEEKYIDLRNKADKLKYISKLLPTNSVARQMYENYVNDLLNYSTDFAKGMNPANRAGLMEMRSRYQDEVGTIADAYALQQEQIKAQRDLLAKDPTILLSRRADLTNLDDYINNPNLSYESYSGAVIAAQVDSAVKAIAKGIDNAMITGTLDKFTNSLLVRQGFNPDEVLAAVQNNGEQGRAKVLNEVVNRVIDSTGIGKWNNPEALDRAYSLARNSLWGAIGEVKQTQYENKQAVLDAQWENERKKLELEDYLQRGRMMLAAKGKEDGDGSSYSNGLSLLNVNPINISNPRDIEKGKEVLSKAEQYKQFFTVKDGKTVLTKRGLEEYNKEVTASIDEYGGHKTSSAFKDFVDKELQGADLMSKRKYGTLGNRFNQLMSNLTETKWDAHKHTEFQYPIKHADVQDVKRAIAGGARNDDLREIVFDAKTGEYRETGNTISQGEFLSDRWDVISINGSGHGITVMAKDTKDNTSHRLKMTSVNPTAQKAAQEQFMQADQITRDLTAGSYTLADGTKVQMTDPDKIQSFQNYYIPVNTGFAYMGQIFGTSETEPQKFQQSGF